MLLADVPNMTDQGKTDSPVRRTRPPVAAWAWLREPSTRRLIRLCLFLLRVLAGDVPCV